MDVSKEHRDRSDPPAAEHPNPVRLAVVGITIVIHVSDVSCRFFTVVCRYLPFLATMPAMRANDVDG